MTAVLRALGRSFGSLGASCVLLLLLALLTWLGTLEQVEHGLYEVQRKYFESFFLVHWAGPVPIPLPGATLVLALLFANLIWGGMVRLRVGRATAGVLVAHVGIVVLLVSGFVKTYFADEGYVTLYEGESATWFQSHHVWEVAVARDEGHGRVREWLVPEADLRSAADGRRVTLVSPDLPFELELSHFLPNSRPLPKGPMFEAPLPVLDGVFLEPRPRDPQAERNLAGVYAAVREPDGTRQEGVLWGAAAAPLVVDAGGERWAIDLRKQRTPLPFRLELDDFRKEDHPRTGMPRSFESDVTVDGGAGGRSALISMNEPLREAGLVLYQASWGPSTARPGDPLFSTFAVVRNPADRAPILGCAVIAIGMVLQFGRKLARHVRAEARR